MSIKGKVHGSVRFGSALNRGIRAAAFLSLASATTPSWGVPDFCDKGAMLMTCIGLVMVDGNTGEEAGLFSTAVLPFSLAVDIALSPFTTTTTASQDNVAELDCSSGSAQCDGGKAAKLLRWRREYITRNYGEVVVQMAQGEGSHLNALAQLFGLPESSYADFSSALQRDLPQLLSRDGSNHFLPPEQVLEKIDLLLRTSSQLRKFAS